MALSKAITDAGQQALFAKRTTARVAEKVPANRRQLIEDLPAYSSAKNTQVTELAAEHKSKVSETPKAAYARSVVAGKNTYTYDAHTYHTKVPPTGIRELLRYYLPQAGLILDPFCGSGMTGVAARLEGHDCILADISPAATFIAHGFTTALEPQEYLEIWQQIFEAVGQKELELYATKCRECGRTVAALYYTWAYDVECPDCREGFSIWDVARDIGTTVRESKVRKVIACPSCKYEARKGAFGRARPQVVEVGYVCCGSRQKERIHPPTREDLELAKATEASRDATPYWFPRDQLANGVNLNQPRRHGLTSVDKLYSGRNLYALAGLWDIACRIVNPRLRQFALFTLTSLYQRITKLAEFRFWGGSGNIARFNVPFIFNELNVYAALERKIKTIELHLGETSGRYSGNVRISTQTCTDLGNIPSESVDLIFTDPPFGGNINYSEMNLLWEAWLSARTDSIDEAIINKYQGKGPREYGELMKKALTECRRVLKSGHWMCLLFHNSSAAVWVELRNAIIRSGFEIRGIQLFDKKHASFKQLVSENAVGYDLIIHCRKPESPTACEPGVTGITSLDDFLKLKDLAAYQKTYAHVRRSPELDYKKLYSEWLTQIVPADPSNVVDFSAFRELVNSYLARTEI